MTTNTFKVTIHMVSSLDGMIAKPDNSVGWFETTDKYEHGKPDMDQEEFSKSVDCYVMGSRTYEHATELAKDYGWPYGDKPTIVVTSRSLKSDRSNIEFYSGDVKRLVNESLKPRYRNVWVVGGPSLIGDFIRLGLADEIRQPILPIILGDGVPFYERIGKELPLHLKDVQAYKNGVVELWYEIRKQSNREKMVSGPQ